MCCFDVLEKSQEGCENWATLLRRCYDDFAKLVVPSGCAGRRNRVFEQLQSSVTSGEIPKLQRAAGSIEMGVADLFSARENAPISTESARLFRIVRGGAE